ncbi:hypothetical protein O181_033330, partial [Austropuccinia psidii MF-1]|nr:hypothetical protein [Austropuccinia psidii MF-1]
MNRHHPHPPISSSSSSSSSSALTEIRFKQPHLLPVLHFDTLGLAQWQTDVIDCDDFASLWNALTKCKRILSDGYRLENITWRLWQREKVLNSRAQLESPNLDSSSLTNPNSTINTTTNTTTTTTKTTTTTTTFTTIHNLNHQMNTLHIIKKSKDVHDNAIITNTNVINSSPCSPSSSSSTSSILSSPTYHHPSQELLSSHSTPLTHQHINQSLSSQNHSSSNSHHDRSSFPSGCFLPLLPPCSSPNTSTLPNIFSISPRPLTSSPSLHITTPNLSFNSRISLSSKTHSLLPPARPNAFTPSSLSNLIDAILPMEILIDHPKTDYRSTTESTTSCLTFNSPSIDPHTESLMPPSTASPSSSPIELVDSQPTPRSGSPKIIQQPHQLQAPPRIVNIAPTPPPASPAVTAPASPAIQPLGVVVNSDEQTSNLFHHQLLSPLPTQLDLDPFLQSSPLKHSLSVNQILKIQAQRPLLGKRYSSGGSTSDSSAYVKSVDTSPSTMYREDLTDHLTQEATVVKQVVQTHTKPTLHSFTRRTVSLAESKLKRKPLFKRNSNSSTRPGGRRMVKPSTKSGLLQSSWQDDDSSQPSSSSSLQQPPTKLSYSSLATCQHPNNLESFPLPSQKCPTQSTVLTTSTNLISQVSEPSSLIEEPSLTNNENGIVETISSTVSSGNVVSPVIPVTPNNSHVSSRFPVRQGNLTNSLASSSATGRSSVLLPCAPPPTPAQNGVPLPTTMSAGIHRNEKVEEELTESPSPFFETASLMSGKKKAQFYINGYETEEDTFSPASLSAQAVKTQIYSTQNLTVSQADLDQKTFGKAHDAEKPSEVINQKEIATQEVQIQEEEDQSNGSDSDEWGSEYSDDECDEDEQIAEQIRQQELERKRQQEAYHRQLFAKKHFIQRNQSHDGIQQPPPIRRAGLSMLFHPELNHLKHHPQPQLQPGQAVEGPNRNQSAVELRHGPSRPVSALRRPTDNDLTSNSAVTGVRSPIGPIPRPCSLVKSKSSVAVPVLANQVSMEMVERSPSAHSGTSSSLQRMSSRTTTTVAATGGGPSPMSGAAPSNQPTRLARPALNPAQQHQRHPSRLGGKPDNVEYSDDDDDDDDDDISKNNAMGNGLTENENNRGQGNIKWGEHVLTEQQRKRLCRLTGTSAAGPMAVAVRVPNRPEPIAPPLSPRTTRRNMLANEMTESVRRNLLWERQTRAQALGILTGGSGMDHEQ